MSNEFVLITRNHKLCRKRGKPANDGRCDAALPCFVPAVSPECRDSFDAKISAILEEIQSYADSVIDLLRDQAGFSRDPKSAHQDLEIVCYGLGRFQSSYIALYQLALLVILRRHFACKCSVFDPLFSAHERHWLQAHEFQVAVANDCAKHRVSRRTLFYMPHCGRPLYNNLIYANWAPDKLANVIILGNNLRNIKQSLEKTSKKNCTDATHCLETFRYVILPVKTNALADAPLPVFPPATDIFNDMAVHWFKDLDTLIEPSEWENCSVPCYSNSEFLDEIIL